MEYADENLLMLVKDDATCTVAGTKAIHTLLFVVLGMIYIYYYSVGKYSTYSRVLYCRYI